METNELKEFSKYEKKLSKKDMENGFLKWEAYQRMSNEEKKNEERFLKNRITFFGIEEYVMPYYKKFINPMAPLYEKKTNYLHVYYLLLYCTTTTECSKEVLPIYIYHNFIKEN